MSDNEESSLGSFVDGLGYPWRNACECGNQWVEYAKKRPDPKFLCEECCDHDFDPDEGFVCLNCGKEGAEDAMAMAYDRAKDHRKYGND